MKVKIFISKDHEELERAIELFTSTIDVHSIDSHYDSNTYKIRLVVKYWDLAIL